jgi:hypothetical protein
VAGVGASGGFDYQSDPNSDAKSAKVYGDVELGVGMGLEAGYQHQPTMQRTDSVSRSDSGDNELKESSVSSAASGYNPLLDPE